MKPYDLDLESQGQGHANVTRVKTLQKVRFSPDCEHAECEGEIYETIAEYEYEGLPTTPPASLSTATGPRLFTSSLQNHVKNTVQWVSRSEIIIVMLLHLIHSYIHYPNGYANILM